MHFFRNPQYINQVKMTNRAIPNALLYNKDKHIMLAIIN